MKNVFRKVIEKKAPLSIWRLEFDFGFNICGLNYSAKIFLLIRNKKLRIQLIYEFYESWCAFFVHITIRKIRKLVKFVAQLLTNNNLLNHRFAIIVDATDIDTSVQAQSR